MLALPEDYTGLSPLEQLRDLSRILRAEVLNLALDRNAHLASNLGVIELTVALFHYFDFPRTPILWDVGHQSYAYKILSGRREEMTFLRGLSGPSGFPLRTESKFDHFIGGHAGTSLAAAAGMAAAMPPKDSDSKVLAVIGDGSLTAGIALEALNQIPSLGLKNITIILNDNGYSIDANVGALASGFTNLENFFEDLGYDYYGPIDGHSITALLNSFAATKHQTRPILLHIKTVKGKGYPPAEMNPVKWHKASAPRHAFSDKKLTFSEVAGRTLLEMAEKDKRILGITAAMTDGTGLNHLRDNLPDQFYDVGICEQYAVTFAAGLACRGKKPVVAIYSAFMQRAYDQLINDVCAQKLGVVFLVDRAGVNGPDGITHQGVFDISFLRCIPNLVLMSPADGDELREMMKTALNLNQPVVIRYPGEKTCLKGSRKKIPVELGKARILRKGEDALILAYGSLVKDALKAANELVRQDIHTTVVNLRSAKPLDQELLSSLLPKFEKICIVEDNALAGGVGGALLELIHQKQITVSGVIKRFGVRDNFVPHGTRAEQQKLNRYTVEDILSFLSC